MHLYRGPLTSPPTHSQPCPFLSGGAPTMQPADIGRPNPSKCGSPRQRPHRGTSIGSSECQESGGKDAALTHLSHPASSADPDPHAQVRRLRSLLAPGTRVVTTSVLGRGPQESQRLAPSYMAWVGARKGGLAVDPQRLRGPSLDWCGSGTMTVVLWPLLLHAGHPLQGRQPPMEQGRGLRGRPYLWQVLMPTLPKGTLSPASEAEGGKVLAGTIQHPRSSPGGRGSGGAREVWALRLPAVLLHACRQRL